MAKAKPTADLCGQQALVKWEGHIEPGMWLDELCVRSPSLQVHLAQTLESQSVEHLDNVHPHCLLLLFAVVFENLGPGPPSEPDPLNMPTFVGSSPRKVEEGLGGELGSLMLCEAGRDVATLADVLFEKFRLVPGRHDTEVLTGALTVHRVPVLGECAERLLISAILEGLPGNEGLAAEPLV